MGEHSNIEWCDATVNPWWGCEKISAACKFCYAEMLWIKFSKANRLKQWDGLRLWGKNHDIGDRSDNAILELERLNRKAKRTGQRLRVFIDSMSDIFEAHAQLDDIRAKFMPVMEQSTHLNILLLTKRPHNWKNCVPEWQTNWPAHIWMGVTVEDRREWLKRKDFIAEIPAPVKYLSVEPMLTSLEVAPDLKKAGIKWVICGGESGSKARGFIIEWAISLRRQCHEQGVAFFMKQLHQKSRFDHTYKIFEAFPEELRVREFPD